MLQRNLLWVAEVEKNEIGPNIRWNKIQNEFASEFFVYGLQSGVTSCSDDSLCSISNEGSKLFVLTNLDAPQHKLVTIEVDDEEKQFKDLIPEDKDANMCSISRINKSNFVVVYQRNASHFCLPLSPCANTFAGPG